MLPFQTRAPRLLLSQSTGFRHARLNRFMAKLVNYFELCKFFSQNLQLKRHFCHKTSLFVHFRRLDSAFLFCYTFIMNAMNIMLSIERFALMDFFQNIISMIILYCE